MEMDEVDYEALPTNSLPIHMAAGAAAGIMEHCIIYPIDSVKTRMQSIRTVSVASGGASAKAVVSANPSILSILRQMTHESIKTPFRGINAVGAGAGPAHALYFATYEKCKRIFSERLSTTNQSFDNTNNFGNQPLATGLAGTVATVVHDGFMNPFDAVKQRMQMAGSPYKGVIDCVQTVYKTEGVGAFYRSYTTQLTMNIPFQSLHFATYEYLRELLNPKGTYDPLTHMVAGAGAGAVASAVTTPLDVAKTLLNTQETVVVGGNARNTALHYIGGMAEAMKTIYTEKGIGGFSKGMSARILFHVPSTAICWSVYEFFKHVIAKRGESLGNEDEGPTRGKGTM
eukprot:Nk52_evm38s1524 gene=Nk52_evmTU38s1524